MSPRIRFEPLGEEIDCASDETVLDAAFRNGFNLVYGCREGQCSACKCFLLEGEVALKRYSNFALSDTEQTNGYSLMCRAMPEQDLVVELLHYDPDGYRLENPIRDGSATVEAIEALTHDITALTLKVGEPSDFSFLPGQYVDLHVPGDAGARRSFSLANVPGDGRIELMIKRYPGGKLSGMLEREIEPGQQITFTGPYGAFHLRRSDRPILMIAAGSGMAPMLSVLRQLSSEGCERSVRFFYGARAERDLFHLELIGELGSRLPDFRFTAVLSQSGKYVQDAVDEYLTETEPFRNADVYMCGPPPMVEAAEEMLIRKYELDEQRIFQDKFTTSADSVESAGADSIGSSPGGELPGLRAKKGAGAGADPIGSSPGGELPGLRAKKVAGAAPPGDDSERQFGWYTPHKRRATLYEDVTVDTQPSVHRHLTRGWPVNFEDGRGTWSDDSTALRSSDWFAFRDPGEQWERPFYQAGTAAEHQIEGAMRSASEEGLLADYSPDWIEFMRTFLQVPAYYEHGLWFATATVARDCLSDSVATCVALQAAVKQRSAQSIVLYAMDLEEHFGDFAIESARDAFLNDEPWQPTRRYLERLAATNDWGEVIVAANLCLEPIVGTLLRRELGTRAAAANGDTVTPVLARVETHEWEWTRAWTTALARFLLDDELHGAANREVIAGWVQDWLPQALQAAAALRPLVEQVPLGIDVDQAVSRVTQYAGAMLEEAGFPELGALVGYDRRERAEPLAASNGEPMAAAKKPTRRQRPPKPTAIAGEAPSLPVESAPADSTYDFVGIVMAKSAEGDAVAEILGRREDIHVTEQPSFWDIRARDRLVIAYDEVSEQLGYDIDAYSIQHEMSTHYGRMVATDDSLMLFSDPTEAMEYLMS
jgi:NAD(P)H-flavin reductase/ferredoxin